jgi:2-dehydro-3-deoxyphosphooctonate aldolase (KDO 8-P synthase)
MPTYFKREWMDFDLADGISIGRTTNPVLIAGPCVIESYEMVLETARFLKKTTDRLGMPFVFKASFDKANRTSVESFRGPGLSEGLAILREVKSSLGVALTTDIHEPLQAEVVAEVVDILQIPAFLCRQTDLLLTAGRTGKPINIKKGQFIAPDAMRFAVDKVFSTSNRRVLVTERGTFWGYGDIVVDLRSIPTMRQFAPVVFDATHSVQQPGGESSVTRGRKEFVPYLARAAAAVGVDAFFCETHVNPDQARSDGPNMWPLLQIPRLLIQFLAIARLGINEGIDE